MAIIENKKIYDHSKSDLPKLEKSFDNLIKKEKELIKTNKALADSLQAVKKSSDGTEARKLSNGINKLTADTKKLKKIRTESQIVAEKLVKANKRLKETYTPQAKALALVRQQTLQQNKALREQAKATLGVKNANRGLIGSLKNLGKQMAGGFGVIALFAALTSVVKNAFKTFVEFQKAASTLKAVTQATTKEMKLLTNQAKALGGATSFTAKQILEADTALAKLGFTTEQITQSIPGILDLAAATGTDLAQSAELAAATLRIFNLDASEMTNVTDVLARATVKSSLSMEKLATIMPTVGKTAQIAGVSLERTAALAGTLTDRGLDASTAGTALRNIFLKLAKDGRTWDGAMQEMNGSTDKLKTSIELFGVRSSAAGIILSETSEGVDKLTEDMKDLDITAAKMAKTMLDNVAGDITIANSAWDKFVLSIEDGEGPISAIIRGLIQDFTEFVNSLSLFNAGDFVTQLKLIWNGFINLSTNAVPGLNQMIGLIEKITGKELPSLKFQIDEATGSTKKQGSSLGFVNGIMKQQADLISKVTQENIKGAELEKEESKGREKKIKELKEIQEEKEKQLELDEKIREKREKDLVAEVEGGELRSQTRTEEKDQAISDQEEITASFTENQKKQQEEILKTREQFIKNGLIVQEATAVAGQQIGDLMAQGLLTFKSFGKILLTTTLDLVQRQVNIWLASLLAREVGTKGAIGLGTFALLSLAINTALGAAKSAVSGFNEGTEFVPGTGNTDTVPAMLTPGERVVPAEINQMLNGIPNSELPNLMNNQDNNMLLANILMSGNKVSQQMLTAILNGGHVVNRNGVSEYRKNDGSIEKFIS